MKIHKNKTEAIKAIKKYASKMKQIEGETGAYFTSHASDEHRLENYVVAHYMGENGTIHDVEIDVDEL